PARPGRRADAAARALSVVRRRHVFFFQAEDGIRGFHVTGVQTCALPISRSSPRTLSASLLRAVSTTMGVGARSWIERMTSNPERSEERRVGKESSTRSARRSVENKTTATKMTNVTKHGRKY